MTSVLTPRGIDKRKKLLDRVQLSQQAKLLCLVVLINIFLVNGVALIAMVTPLCAFAYVERGWTGCMKQATSETVIPHVNSFLHGRQGNDSWEPMLIAWDYVESKHSEPLYSEVLINRSVKFQYPPSSLAIFVVLDKFTTNRAHWETALNVLSWLSILFTLIFVMKILNTNDGGPANTLTDKEALPFGTDRIIRGVLGGVLVITFYPVVKAYSAGQAQVWINALFAASFWCWIKDKKQFSGLIIGIMCLIKPTYALIGLWGLWRREWKFLAAIAATVAIGLMLSVWRFGFADHLDYLTALSYMGERGEGYYTNQSMNGLLNRLLSTHNNIEWSIGFPPYNFWVYSGTLISSIALILAALFVPARAQHGSTADFAAFVLAATMASPIAWGHHYGVLLPIYAYLISKLVQAPRLALGTAAYLLLGFVLSSNFFGVSKALAPTPVNFAQSYVFIAGLMLLAYLLASQRSMMGGGSQV